MAASPNNFILALDQGTSGTTGLLVDTSGNIVAHAYQEVKRDFPEPGWVEQDAEELFISCLDVVNKILADSEIKATQIHGIGIANQRETTVIWDRHTGLACHQALVWQDRRTEHICEELKASGLEPAIRDKTGLVIDAYFSGTKLRWMLDHIPEGQRRAENGDFLFGTVDSWLAWRLTGGKQHVTDYTNASRTMLFNIHELEWDHDLLLKLNVPEIMLPEVIPSCGVFGETAAGILSDHRVPLAPLSGDQQAALFGQACFSPGMTKNTYGTGCFVLQNTGHVPIASNNGLITTLACAVGTKPDYAIEGSIFVTGAAIQWLRDGLGVIQNVAETENLAQSVPDTNGVHFVPAFNGLGAPYWDKHLRGTITGLSQGVTKAHIVRAALESIAYQTRDVISLIQKDTGINIHQLRVDGGGTDNAFLMQFQADILGMPIEVSSIRETTCLGAAYLAGLGLGVWQNTSEIAGQRVTGQVYYPRMVPEKRESLYAGWQRTISSLRQC